MTHKLNKNTLNESEQKIFQTKEMNLNAKLTIIQVLKSVSLSFSVLHFSLTLLHFLFHSFYFHFLFFSVLLLALISRGGRCYRAASSLASSSFTGLNPPKFGIRKGHQKWCN